jgi:hypothetical protein
MVKSIGHTSTAEYKKWLKKMKKATKTVKPSAGKQMSEESRTRVERATVRLVERGGRGVLVPGEFIITATHCIVWSGAGGMPMGDVDPGVRLVS